MRAPLQVEVAVDAPAERLWAAMVDVERWPAWTPSMRRVRYLSTGGLRRGNVVVIRQPRSPSMRWTIEEVVPGRSFTWVARSPGVVTVARHEVEPGPPTRLRLSVQWSGPAATIVRFLAGRRTRRFLALEAEGLAAAAGAAGGRGGT